MTPGVQTPPGDLLVFAESVYRNFADNLLREFGPSLGRESAALESSGRLDRFPLQLFRRPVNGRRKQARLVAAHRDALSNLFSSAIVSLEENERGVLSSTSPKS